VSAAPHWPELLLLLLASWTSPVAASEWGATADDASPTDAAEAGIVANVLRQCPSGRERKGSNWTTLSLKAVRMSCTSTV